MEKKIRPNAVYITCLPDDVTEEKITEVFGAIGIIKTNRKTGGPSVTLYNDKRTNKFKVGELARITVCLSLCMEGEGGRSFVYPVVVLTACC